MIYLHHDYIGKRYAHALFSKIEQELFSAGYTHIVLDVLSQNNRAVKFYEKHGYTNVDKRFVMLGAKDYPLTVFRKGV
ncbi:GNAT family N-acetyltransferase [Lachnospiraceae bacterium ZAX-1]